VAANAAVQPGPSIKETNVLLGLSPDLPTVVEIDVNAISTNPNQPRSVFDDTGLQSLAASIADHGLQQPVLLREAPEKGRYILVAGERRLRAHRRLGRPTIFAVLIRADADPDELALVENVQREDLDAVDWARGVRRLIAQRGYTLAAAGALVGCSESEVARRTKVLDLPADILAGYQADPQAVTRNQLIEIAYAGGEEAQRRLWQLARSGSTVQQLRRERPKRDADREPIKVFSRGILRIGRTLDDMAEARKGGGPLVREHCDRLRELRDRIDTLLAE
jgi:ParB family chromosome partitioning protein